MIQDLMSRSMPGTLILTKFKTFLRNCKTVILDGIRLSQDDPLAVPAWL